MLNKIVILLLTISFSLAGIIEDFKNRNYQKVCKIENINSTRDEKILSLIGISCVKSDNLYLLPYIVRKLKYTKLARLNSIYFSTIYLQKKLLYSYFFDGLSLDSFDLPDSDYILSHVFYKIKRDEYKKVNNFYIINYKDEIIKVYKKDDKLFVDEYKNNKLLKRHWYK